MLSGKFLSWHLLSRKIRSADCTTSSASSGPQTAILVLSGLQAKKAAGWWRSKLLLCFRVSETGSRSQIITVISFESDSVVNHAMFHGTTCIPFLKYVALKLNKKLRPDSSNLWADFATATFSAVKLVSTTLLQCFSLRLLESSCIFNLRIRVIPPLMKTNGRKNL